MVYWKFSVATKYSSTETLIFTHAVSLFPSSFSVELSEVLWTMVIKRGIGMTLDLDSPAFGSLFLFYLFAFWAGEFTKVH